MVKHAILSYLKAVAVSALLLFVPAGTIDYWQGWVFIFLFSVPMLLIMFYLIKFSPDLLKRRLDVREKNLVQAILAKAFYITVCLILAVAGLDRRFAWSNVPSAMAVAAQAIFLAAYTFLFFVFKQNKYLAHTVKVEEGQQLVTTGTYAVVRHPMYFSELVMFVSAAPALGSWWAMLPNLLMAAILVIRIMTEEELLFKGLKGYPEYAEKTRYRLIPGVW